MVIEVSGEMQEWFNWHAWKACVPQKGTGGSNPPLSAKPNYSLSEAGGFLFSELSKLSLRKIMKIKRPYE